MSNFTKNNFMKKQTFLLLTLSACILLMASCNLSRTAKTSQPKTETTGTGAPPPQKPKRPSALANGKFFEKNGRRYLYGGERG